jgi:hypothetical protein
MSKLFIKSVADRAVVFARSFSILLAVTIFLYVAMYSLVTHHKTLVIDPLPYMAKSSFTFSTQIAPYKGLDKYYLVTISNNELTHYFFFPIDWVVRKYCYQLRQKMFYIFFALCVLVPIGYIIYNNEKFSRSDFWFCFVSISLCVLLFFIENVLWYRLFWSDRGFYSSTNHCAEHIVAVIAILSLMLFVLWLMVKQKFKLISVFLLPFVCAELYGLFRMILELYLYFQRNVPV